MRSIRTESKTYPAGLTEFLAPVFIGFVRSASEAQTAERQASKVILLNMISVVDCKRAAGKKEDGRKV